MAAPCCKMAAMAHTFAGFEIADVAGWPLLWLRDDRFKTFRVSLVLLRAIDERQAARALLPSLLSHGTRRHPDRPALARAAEALFGARLGASLSRHGVSSALRFSLDAVAADYLPGEPDQMGAGLELLAEYAARPRLDAAGAFPDDTFLRERAQALADARGLIEDKAGYARQRAMHFACAGEPYAIADHGGEEAIAALTARDPASALADTIAEGTRLCVLAGSLPDPLPSQLQKVLAGLAARGAAERQPLPADIPQRAAGRTVERAEMKQAKLVQVYRAPRAEHPDRHCALQACLSLWGGGAHSRLFQQVRERLSLCYYVSASGDSHTGLAFVQVGCESNKADAVLAETGRQLDQIARGEFEDQDLATTLASIDGGIAAMQDSLGARMNFAVEQWLRGFDEDLVGRRRRFARVGRAEVIEAARSIWLDHSYELHPEEAGA